MSLALLFHYLMLNMFRMLIHPSSGACDLFVELFHGLYCSGSMCVGVTLWFGWGGVVSGCRLKHCFKFYWLISGSCSLQKTETCHSELSGGTTHFMSRGRSFPRAVQPLRRVLWCIAFEVTDVCGISLPFFKYTGRTGGCRGAE